MQLKDIQKTEKEVLEDGNHIVNNTLVKADIIMVGHVGNMPCLVLEIQNSYIMSDRNATNNLGRLLKALVEILDIQEEDGAWFSTIDDVSIRIILDSNNECIGFGSCKKDKFVYTDQFARL